MNKSTKGALAAGAAATLLLGGAGSLAYWTADADVSASAISSGELSLGKAACGDWKFDGALETAAVYVPGTDKLVPGDTITRTCTMAITATGKHLKAKLEATGGALSDEFTVTPKIEIVNDADQPRVYADSAPVTEKDATVRVTQSVNFKIGDATSVNTSQNSQKLNKELALYTVKLTQFHD